jgi:hypothetical protein
LVRGKAESRGRPNGGERHDSRVERRHKPWLKRKRRNARTLPATASWSTARNTAATIATMRLVPWRSRATADIPNAQPRRPPRQERKTSAIQSRHESRVKTCEKIAALPLCCAPTGGQPVIGGRDPVVPCALARSGPLPRSLAHLHQAAGYLPQLSPTPLGVVPRVCPGRTLSCWALPADEASCLPDLARPSRAPIIFFVFRCSGPQGLLLQNEPRSAEVYPIG